MYLFREHEMFRSFLDGDHDHDHIHTKREYNIPATVIAMLGFTFMCALPIILHLGTCIEYVKIRF